MNIEAKTVNTLRLLAVDSIEKANSGHPGMPLGATPMMFALWAKQMKHFGRKSKWPNRDRFVLSAGHASAMQYSFMHLFDYGISIDDLKSFRQKDSKCPGHPEYGHTEGIDISTGPLGQGLAAATGLAIAEARLAAKYNRDIKVFDHYTYAITGDGCLMEGVSSEAASLAGQLGLSKLIVLYDCNEITIDGNISITFDENVLARYEAYNWHVQEVDDGNSIDAISKAIENAKHEENRPSFIKINTKIGYGSPNKAGKSAAHGSPLGKEELEKCKEYFGFDKDKFFFVAEDVKSYLSEIIKRSEIEYDKYQHTIKKYSEKYQDLYQDLVYNYPEFKGIVNIELEEEKVDFEELKKEFTNSRKDKEATRDSSHKILNAFKESKVCKLGNSLIGGSADLNASTKAFLSNSERFSKECRTGDTLAYGIREFAMACVAYGISAYGGLKPFCSTFFVFSDYMKPAIRQAALMKLPVIFLFTHDSVAVGEDGPTHHPIEHLLMLRTIPNLKVYRPADIDETFYSYSAALLEKDGPSAIVLSRQALKTLNSESEHQSKGVYNVGKDYGADCTGILIATGSEVNLALEMQKKLDSRGEFVNVVSAYSTDLINSEVFGLDSEKEKEAYLSKVLRFDIKKRMVIEASHPQSMYKFIDSNTKVAGIDNFMYSAKATDLLEDAGFTVSKLIQKYLED